MGQTQQCKLKEIFCLSRHGQELQKFVTLWGCWGLLRHWCFRQLYVVSILYFHINLCLFVFFCSWSAAEAYHIWVPTWSHWCYCSHPMQGVMHVHADVTCQLSSPVLGLFQMLKFQFVFNYYQMSDNQLQH